MESHNFDDVKVVVQACVNSRRSGIPLQKLDAEFTYFYGSPIPYAYFGFSNLKSYLYSLPDIYIEGENVIFCSEKSRHITKLVHSEKFDCVSSHCPKIESSKSENVVSPEEFSKLVRLLVKFIHGNTGIAFRKIFSHYFTIIKQWVTIFFLI